MANVSTEKAADGETIWQEALDRLAYFNMLAIPDSERPNRPSYQNGKLTEVVFRGKAHRLDVAPGEIGGKHGYRTSNTVGAEAGPFEFRWSPIPQDFALTEGARVPATAFDHSLSQRFAVTDARFAIGQGGNNSIKGFGSGRTYPIYQPGKEGSLPPGGLQLTRIAANGVITSGEGVLADSVGMFAISGLFTPPDDFQLNVFVMVKDPGSLYTESELPVVEPVKDLPGNSTFLYFSTFVPTVTSTDIGFGPAGPSSFDVHEKLRLCETNFSGRGPQGLASRYQIGPTVGEHPVHLKFSPTSGNGTSADDPSASYDAEAFKLYDGAEHVGTLKIETDEIRALIEPLDGVPEEMFTQMFAGFGPVSGGDGAFAGAQGFQINLGVGTGVPHLSSILYLFELADPTGRFRSTDGK